MKARRLGPLGQVVASRRRIGDDRGVRSAVGFVVVLAGASAASAGKYRVERGQTLEHVAQIHGCSTEAVLRANRLDTTLVPAGTVVVIPTCTIRTRARTRDRERPEPLDDDERARRALEVIDGVTFVARAQPARDDAAEAESIGTPQNGRLQNSTELPRGAGYRIRRPHRAFGASHVIDHLRRVIGEVRALHPDVHTLAVGDLSAEHGGKLGGHVSHQSGLDVDLGLYYRKVPADYPKQFVAAGSEIDLEATWALITSFARTARLDTGVQVILLDHDLQARLYKWASARGTPDDQLAEILQYPRSKDTIVGLVRHWPKHADHLHVRFKPRR